ncbi:carboxylesterase family protein [Cystobacter fuscus]
MTNNITLPIINTVEGPVQGALVEDVIAYMGIPYAAKPLGDLRWRAPQPVTPWTQTLPSNDQAPSCLQNRDLCIEVGGGDPRIMSEDCLYLNVWTPQPKAGAPKRPVMVWIHGGAYIIGAGSLPIYHGAPFVNRGAILVTINYRMGALGFFAHPALEKEVTVEQQRIYNFGLLDQIAALEWVQRNIAKFGGDPDNVTIFGQSAGARSVLALFASPLTKDREKPLFHRGIAQSVYRTAEAPGEGARARHQARGSRPRARERARRDRDPRAAPRRRGGGSHERPHRSREGFQGDGELPGGDRRRRRTPRHGWDPRPLREGRGGGIAAHHWQHQR